ncbi:peptidoglycan-associated lipoprotein Pal [Hydrogenovibrio kuenenii]|uniref:peptidoglycan-associated lipoprotein Pal n=1 Tax=Hydrogenovibrio kuenenii TaxID=63658 RepID=UPI000465D892|nr:peptidoglycan-associated lipoprotein Pal [Hydrogenovibrio kuenenii]
MSVSSLKQLFLVAFLGLTLVGCSSTPSKDESAAQSNATTASGDGAAASGQDQATGGAAQEASAEPTVDGKTASQLLAALQGQMVHFDFDRSEIKPEFYDIIKMNADYMSLDTNAKVTIKGYCDERGTPEYNLALGERRADAVKNALIAQGVSPSRINVISYGEENPIDPGHTEAAWSKNRRAVFSY